MNLETSFAMITGAVTGIGLMAMGLRVFYQYDIL